ncbi:methylated-DNA--[protein]-cysteine S-methyltransferase [Chitinivorax sp. B]|uniref:methylated-DNA--[protein]-cysteine S-methyltransferase n=1 Tax=Chitinivorax sp. B TaxID=2502235 RepID=UPI0010F9278C|nr:methylated-DNA--[protein]-cysteine S-methyltransferase [Chitinivorax sp. B]
MQKEYQAILEMPVTKLGIKTDQHVLKGIDFLPLDTAILAPCTAIAEGVCQQLQCYLEDSSFVFDLPLQLTGTAFQQQVWHAIGDVPAGQTQSYAMLAAKIGSVARAVGQACGANPIPLIIPCHRIVAQYGVGGFSHQTAGTMLTIKQWLLWHEGLADFVG